jgi:hypothetical protein
MGTRSVGTCSLCGGAVVVPDWYLSTVPPTPRCASCNAVPVAPHGPVVAMRPYRPLSQSPAGRIAEVQFLLKPTDLDGNELPPMITPEEARDLLNTSGGWS